jgi:hypothetical protein
VLITTGCSGTNPDATQPPITTAPQETESTFQKVTGESIKEYCLDDGEITNQDTIFIYNLGQQFEYNVSIMPQPRTPTPELSPFATQTNNTSKGELTNKNDSFNISSLYRSYSGLHHFENKTVVVYLDSKEFTSHNDILSRTVKIKYRFTYVNGEGSYGVKDYQLKYEGAILAKDHNKGTEYLQINCEEYVTPDKE